MSNLKISRVVIASIVIIAGFIILYNIFTPANLIILLNGLFVGSLVSIAIAYHELVWMAIRGDGIYDRIRQMTLGFAVQWLVIIIGASTSIYIRMADLPTTTFTMVALSRYLAIVAAILQVTAPDFGLGLFHGRDRKVLTASVITGLIVSFAVIVAQGGA